jgi:hypothetical protein
LLLPSDRQGLRGCKKRSVFYQLGPFKVRAIDCSVSNEFTGACRDFGAQRQRRSKSRVGCDYLRRSLGTLAHFVNVWRNLSKLFAPCFVVETLRYWPLHRVPASHFQEREALEPGARSSPAAGRGRPAARSAEARGFNGHVMSDQHSISGELPAHEHTDFAKTSS